MAKLCESLQSRSPLYRLATSYPHRSLRNRSPANERRSLCERSLLAYCWLSHCCTPSNVRKHLIGTAKTTKPAKSSHIDGCLPGHLADSVRLNQWLCPY